MAKPTVYLESTVIGHLTGRMQSDPVIAGRQTVTREWWSTAAQYYRLLISQLVIDECSAGDVEAAAERLAAIKQIDLIQNSPQTEALASLLIQRGAVPASEPRDALHISLAAVNGVEYLLTWNFKHIANASTRDLIEHTCATAGYDPPLVLHARRACWRMTCTPTPSRKKSALSVISWPRRLTTTSHESLLTFGSVKPHRAGPLCNCRNVRHGTSQSNKGRLAHRCNQIPQPDCDGSRMPLHH